MKYKPFNIMLISIFALTMHMAYAASNKGYVSLAIPILNETSSAVAITVIPQVGPGKSNGYMCVDTSAETDDNCNYNTQQLPPYLAKPGDPDIYLHYINSVYTTDPSADGSKAIIHATENTNSNSYYYCEVNFSHAFIQQTAAKDKNDTIVALTTYPNSDKTCIFDNGASVIYCDHQDHDSECRTSTIEIIDN
ncbi:MAG: hypothetical protein EP298_04245 [Gammaproteobacteria bacterium]|nr:MAG: hypothetical protein EP298_04245 [Gammaproteobacteria bacterium]UTW43841.1 hypothetical protein KFE69_07055 [bacterium SCSIO 12844]